MTIIISEQDPMEEKFLYFVITKTAGTPGTISVNPKPPGEVGLFPGGHARVNNRNNGARWLVWEFESAQDFQIEFHEMASSGGPAGGDITDLFHTIVGVTQVGGKWVFKGKLRKGSGFETIAYKYTVTIEGCEDLDPLIIVDR